MKEIKRCDWACKTEIEQVYHDKVWGRPCHDERELFKMLILEGQQAGLSWLTILKKMPAMEIAYDNFDPEILANYGEEKIAELMQNPAIIRNRLKIKAAINNAKRYFELCEEGTSLDAYLWTFVDYQPIINTWASSAEVPASTPLSEKISKDLKKRGFQFVGPTIIYAYMQAIGMVNDHLVSCDFYRGDDKEEGAWKQ